MDRLTLQQRKVGARSEARALLAATTQQQSHLWGSLMLQHLQALPVWGRATTVFCFCSTSTEPDTQPLLKAVLNSGRTLCIPRTGPEKGQMEAVRIGSLFGLHENRFGICEPPFSLPATSPQEIDLVIAPCLAAAPGGIRLGHGGGYYDRFLAQTNCPSVVLCPEALIFESLPCGPQDITLDLIITEKGVL